MTFINKILICIIAITLYSSCTDKNFNEQLNQAESLIDINTDSALHILDNINLKDISAESQKAKYILLSTHIKAKLGMSLTDSTINITANYYKNHGNTKEQVLSLLYQSNYLINKSQLDKAMLNLLQVEDLLTKFDDYYAKGYHNLLLGAIYAYYYDFKNASVAYTHAYTHFKRLENGLLFQTLIKLFEGMMYYNLAISYEKSITLIKHAKTDAEKLNEETLITLCNSLLIVMYVETKQLNEAFKLAEYINDKKDLKLANNIHAPLYSSLAYLYHLKGNLNMSSHYMNLATQTAQDKKENTNTYLNRLMDIAVLDKNYKKAYQLSLQSRENSYNKMLKLLERPLMTSQRDYLKKELEQNKTIQHVEKQRNIAVILSILLIAIAAILYLRHLNKNKQNKLNEYADAIIELQLTLQENKSAASELIETLYKDQFKILNGISDSFFNQNNDAKGQKYVYNQVRYLIEQFSKDKKSLQELEDIVNKCCNNVMRKLREEIPTFDEIDYRQLCYHYAGFSGKLISILLDKSQANVYMRKSRLKEKIQQTISPSQKEILEYLG